MALTDFTVNEDTQTNHVEPGEDELVIVKTRHLYRFKSLSCSFQIPRSVPQRTYEILLKRSNVCSLEGGLLHIISASFSP